MSGLPPRGFLKRTEAQSLVAATRQNATMLAGAGARVTVYPNGTIVEMPRGLRPRAKPVPRAPWYLAGVRDGEDLKIRVAPGMVNNFVPTIDVGGTPKSLVAIPAPALTVTGSSGVVHLKATVDAAGAITTLVIESAVSLPSDTSTLKHKIIGAWTASGGAFTSATSVLNTNQTLYLCNGTAIWEA